MEAAFIVPDGRRVCPQQQSRWPVKEQKGRALRGMEICSCGMRVAMQELKKREVVPMRRQKKVHPLSPTGRQTPKKLFVQHTVQCSSAEQEVA